MQYIVKMCNNVLVLKYKLMFILVKFTALDFIYSYLRPITSNHAHGCILFSMIILQALHH